MKTQLNEVQKLQKIAGIAKSELKEDNGSKYQDLLNQLRDLASSGEINNDDIRNINKELLSARRKMFTSKVSPEKRSVSAQKGKVTKELEKIKSRAEEEVNIKYGFLDKNGDIADDGDVTDWKSAVPSMFALNVGAYRDKAVQKKWNKDVSDLIAKYGKEAGLSDDPALQKALDRYA
jgi:hypothetical protein